MKEIGPFTLDMNTTVIKGGVWWPEDVQSGLCAKRLSSWFDLDDERPLWVRVHNEAGKNRLEVRRNPDGNVFLITRGGRKVSTVVFGEWLASPPASYPYYVEIMQ